MTAEETDRDGSCPILNGGHQPVVAAFDIENDPASLENAHLRIRRLDILRIAPIGAGHNGEPGFILRSRCFDPFMAGVIRQIAFDHIRPDDDH